MQSYKSWGFELLSAAKQALAIFLGEHTALSMYDFPTQAGDLKRQPHKLLMAGAIHLLLARVLIAMHGGTLVHHCNEEIFSNTLLKIYKVKTINFYLPTLPNIMIKDKNLSFFFFFCLFLIYEGSFYSWFSGTKKIMEATLFACTCSCF